MHDTHAAWHAATYAKSLMHKHADEFTHKMAEWRTTSIADVQFKASYLILF